VWFNATEDSGSVRVLSQAGDILLRRIRRQGVDGDPSISITVLAASERPASNSLTGLTREYELTEYLDRDWALRPLELVQEHGQSILILEDPGGELLSQLLGAPMEVERFLHLAIGITASVSKMHQRGLVHRDIKPANILVNSRDGEIRLTGFGIASRVPRERQPPEPPHFIAGTLAYMAPEQTGRMNRSIDSRSDLYALGVTFYQMLTGNLPFDAADAMEWIHCHIARQPVSPTSLVPGVPPAISAIIVKLLAKAAEDRYQTAVGLEQDLRRCLADWEALQQVDTFVLGEHDVPDRLLIPEKLYGRERDIDSLLAAFDNVLANGTPELVLVSGYSGIGKSAVVNELHKVLVLPRGLFASGKFDQYKRDIPYATLAQAFQSLIRQLLGQPETELSKWRDALVQTLDPNGLLITDLIPELKLIIGEQPAVPELPPQQAKARFQLVFRRFISVFARREHPLALFLDDLQWLDAATLDLVESLLTQPDVRYLLLIGAYRDNEVDPAHPLMRKLEAIRQGGAKTRLVILAPLGREDLNRLIVDSLYCDSGRAAPLAQLIHEKTSGNPFFAIQFISTLVDEALLTFDHADARWQWDLSRIDAKGYTDNVVDLMAGKLNRLPVETQETLQQLACLGNSAEITFLSMVQETSEDKIHADLWEARRAELVVRSETSYKFVHDRVQEAAYSLLPAERRAETHLRLGRLLATHIPPDKREEAIFEVVAQFDRGVELIASRDEREQLAELNLVAGRRAKASAAYASALKYLISGATLLADDCWERRHDLVFQLELQRAECEFLTGDLKTADERLTMLSSRAATVVEQSAVECLRVDLYTTLDRPDHAVSVGLAYLRKLGIEWSPHPTNEETRREYELIWSQLGGRAIEELIDLPLMSDPASLATLDVLGKVVAPAIFTDANLFALVVYRMINLSLQKGNSDGSCLAYAALGSTANARFGDSKIGFRFGYLGYELVERRGLKRFQARTYVAFGKLVPWTQHVRASCDIANRAIEAALKIGDLTYATYSLNLRNAYRLAAGDPLAEVQREAESGIEFERRAGVGLSVVAVATQLSLIRTLRGLAPKFGSLDGNEFDELSFERHLASDPGMASSECWYWIRKLQARFLAGDHLAAVEAASRAELLFFASAAYFEEAEYHFYAALSHAACCNFASSRQRQQHVEALAAHHRQLEAWAENCPANFENRVALVRAEIARIEGRELEAMRLYERAINAARTNGFVNNEGIANELAARFHAACGFEMIAKAYLQEARSCYLRWGADGKVRQLETLHPWLHKPDPVGAADTTIATRIELLDLATVVKVSQALSGEMVLDRLIDALMRLAIEHAGAERGVLLLLRGNELRQEAEAIIGGNSIVVRRPDEPAATLPDTIVQYVMRAREVVILDDASTDPTYSADSYVLGRKARSVLCLPLVNESRVTGVLYLENNLTPGVFTPSRTAVLKLLALQAAIALENAYLYGDLAQAEKALSASERDLQLTIDTIPALVWSTRTDGSVEFVNQNYCDYVGLQPEQFMDWGWTVAVHPDDVERLKAVWMEITASGKGGEAEARFRRADGEYRWFLARANPLHDGNGNIVRWYGVNTDIDERKRAEEKAREAERELQRTIDGIPALAATYDADGSRMSVNKLGRDFTGLSAEDVTSGRWSIAIHPDDIELAESKWAACVASGEPFEHEYRTRAADGTYRWYVARRVPMRDETGKVIRWYGVSHDIDDRKRAEALLSGEKHVLEMIASGRPLREVLAALCGFFEGSAPDCHCGIYPIDRRSNTFEFGIAPSLPASYTDPIEGASVGADHSPRGQSISGKTQVIAEDIGTDPRWMEAPCRAHVLEHGLRAIWSTPICLRDGTVIGTVCVYQQKSGSPSPYHQELIGHVAHLASIAIERSQAEAALRRSETLITEGQRLSLTGSFLWKVDTDERIFSEELQRIFEFEPNVVVTAEILAERVHPDDLPLLAEKITQVQSGGDNPEYEIRLRMPDGRIKFARVFGRTIPREDGRVECIGAVQDVTLRRRAEEARDKVRSELMHVSRVVSLGALTASIAHEVNQPLASIITSGETGLRWLARPEPDLEKVQRLTKRIVDDARRAAEIIDRIRTMASRGATKQSVVTLSEIVAESTTFLQHEFQARGVSVSLELAPGLLKVFGDRTQLQQVIVNLAMNAVQALTKSDAANKCIAIRTRQIDAETVCCIVEDSGPGIDAEHLPRLFDSFFTTKETGMGLGLAMAQSIIEAHNGRIRADNNSALGGARFIFDLPVVHAS